VGVENEVPMEELNKKEQAVSIMAFLVKNWRKAVNHRGDFEPIMDALQGYLNALKKHKEITDREIDIWYLEAKIKVTEEQVKDYKERLKIYESKNT